MSGSTKDGFLGGRVVVRQAQAGFRSGLDAVMLAAAVPAKAGDVVLELGSGAGAASLCVAVRAQGCAVEGLEIDAELVRLANANAAENGLAGRVAFHTGDVMSPPSLLRREFVHVFANPPFHDTAGHASPDADRDLALRDAGRFADWLAAGLRRTVSGGTFTVILRADRLGEALTCLPQTGIVIFPLWPRPGVAAKRLVVQARKGARSPALLLPGLLLHDTKSTYTQEAEAILRDGARLALDNPQL